MASALKLWSERASIPGGRALIKLGGFAPSPEHAGRVLHQLPVADRAEYLASIPRGPRMNRLIEDAPVEEVQVARLVGIQRSVNPGRVAEYIADPGLREPGHLNPKSGTPDDQPVVVKKGGTLYLHDGHHRTMAALLSGEPTIRARVVDLDAVAPPGAAA